MAGVGASLRTRVRVGAVVRTGARAGVGASVSAGFSVGAVVRTGAEVWASFGGVKVTAGARVRVSCEGKFLI